MNSSVGPKEVVCEFQDNAGPVALRCSLIRSIYQLPVGEEGFSEGERTIINYDSINEETGHAEVDQFSVKTSTMEAIAEWKRGLAKMYG